MTSRINSFEEYKEQYALSVQNPEAFWADKAEQFTWKKKWDKVLDWDFETPNIEWFSGATLNITENCIDRHLDTQADQIALIWEPNDPTEPEQKFTYQELHDEVCKLANLLKQQGVQKGDRVCLYMPMIPQLTFAVLACARIGAVHSVVFAGFSAQALADRIKDAQCKVVLTTDGGYRGKKNLAIKPLVDEALTMACDSVTAVLVYRRTQDDVPMHATRDIDWAAALQNMAPHCPAETMSAEDMLFILYTSGSTGTPKGVVHTCGGYMVYTEYSFRNVFQYTQGDIYWCTADIGWITGHSYLIYGPLLAGATTIMFEGIPTFPDAGRFWQICEKYQVNQFYTAPTAIRALMAQGDEFVEKYDLSSLKVLGTVGEPINVEAWTWYNEKVGQQNCPIVDTWWQTETGGILISPLAGHTPLKPCFATQPLPGIQPVLLDKEGNILEGEAEGLLCVQFPWPSMLRTTYGDHERCQRTYFSAFKNMYFTGDGAKRDAKGNYRIIGRVDDVMNISGHRIGTAEVENALNEHPAVVESAVVGYPHDIKGQGIYAYVICDEEVADIERFEQELRELLTVEIGPIAKPDKVQIVQGLPKTRSGKIMRRILRKIASGETNRLGDTSTLLNPEIVTSIIQGASVHS